MLLIISLGLNPLDPITSQGQNLGGGRQSIENTLQPDRLKVPLWLYASRL
jgi:hypothetical protein